VASWQRGLAPAASRRQREMRRPWQGPQRGYEPLEIPRLAVRRYESQDGCRYYITNEGVYPSATTIISAVVGKPGLISWVKRTALETVRRLVANGADLEDALQVAEMEAERLRDEAALRGSRVHAAVVRALVGQDYAPEWRGWVQAAQAFLAHHNLKPIAAEVVLISRCHAYGGTADLICQADDGSVVLVDWKSGRHPFMAESALQVGAYSLGFFELVGCPVTQGYVVALRESGRYEARSVNLHLAQEAFLHCLQLWKALRGEGAELYE
jgi:hypothetical protein